MEIAGRSRGGHAVRLLLIEDERKHVRFIRQGLEEEQFAIDVAADGEEAMDLIEAASYDLIILDLMLPKGDGFELLKCLRTRRYLIPVLILTAKTAIEDKVKGFELGSDDYLTKPFAFEELVARIRNLLRRNSPSQPSLLTIGDLTLNPLTRTVWQGQQFISLTNKEFSILEYLMRHPNRVLTRTMIFEHVWDFTCSIESNVIDVYMTMLRKKVDPEKKLIQTVRGAGYIIKTAPWA